MNKKTVEQVAENSTDFVVPEVLPVLSLSELVVFPNIIVPMAISNEAMVRLINDALGGDKLIGCFTLKPTDDESDREIYKVGTCCQIIKMFRIPDGSVRLLVRGTSRITLLEIMREHPYPLARVDKLQVDRRRPLNLEAMTRQVAENFRHLIDISPNLSEEIKIALNNVNEP
ncbi:MAG: LON peptidase substrate-binding domain-containing protein, partial [bacterium]